VSAAGDLASMGRYGPGSRIQAVLPGRMTLRQLMPPDLPYAGLERPRACPPLSVCRHWL